MHTVALRTESSLPISTVPPIQLRANKVRNDCIWGIMVLFRLYKVILEIWFFSFRFGLIFYSCICFLFLELLGAGLLEVKILACSAVDLRSTHWIWLLCGYFSQSHMGEMFAFHSTTIANSLQTPIIVFTRTGSMAVLLSHYQPCSTIFAFTNEYSILIFYGHMLSCGLYLGKQFLL